jgi:signal transduction histidine kinase
VVDDEPENLRLIGALLLPEGYELFVAASGREALATARLHRPDLVLLDVMMPDMDGFETCRRLKQLPICVPQVVFLTAMQDTDAQMKGFDAGGADFIGKPFDSQVLLARVRTHASLGRMNKDIRDTLDQRNGELVSASAQLVQLSRELAATEERERRQLATDLHDGPIQELALARIQMDVALGDNDPIRFKQSLGATAKLLQKSLADLRTLLFDLSPPAMTTSGLNSALQRLARHISLRWPVEVEFETDGEPIEPDEGRLLALFRSARELLVNAAKHSGADSISLKLIFDTDRLLLVVTDRGRGFDPDAAHGTGFGLDSVRERLTVYGGSLLIESSADGTRTEARLPLYDPDSPLGSTSPT